ncbi:MAG: M15 family metallopeptidase, partial [Bacteroidales bacterium]|nr:M15 family metallopeptidase [Bacteroidales bacterium]
MRSTTTKIKINKQNTVIFGGVALFIVIIAITIFFVVKKRYYKVDAENEQKIKQLHPKLRFKARKFISNAKRKGYDLRITESLRTFDRQNNLYAQGRTTSGQIVTNAKAGSSFHNYGLAIDVVDRKNGYNTNWAEIGKIGKKAGFTWGGDWQGFTDRPHFQIDLGYKISELLQLYNSGKWTNYTNT